MTINIDNLAVLHIGHFQGLYENTDIVKSQLKKLCKNNLVLPLETCNRRVILADKSILEQFNLSELQYPISGDTKIEILYGLNAYKFLLEWGTGIINFHKNRFTKGNIRGNLAEKLKPNTKQYGYFIKFLNQFLADISNIRNLIDNQESQNYSDRTKLKIATNAILNCQISAKYNFSTENELLLLNQREYELAILRKKISDYSRDLRTNNFTLDTNYLLHSKNEQARMSALFDKSRKIRQLKDKFISLSLDYLKETDLEQYNYLETNKNEINIINKITFELDIKLQINDLSKKIKKENNFSPGELKSLNQPAVKKLAKRIESANELKHLKKLLTDRESKKIPARSLY